MVAEERKPEIVELGMIEFRLQIGQLRKRVTSGDVIIKMTEGRAGPPPQNTDNWERETVTVGYVVSPQLFEAMQVAAHAAGMSSAQFMQAMSLKEAKEEHEQVPEA